MHILMLILFWVCFGMIAWIYFGYPLALKFGLLGRRSGLSFANDSMATHRESASSLPEISVIIPAHNEEAGIEAKLRNLLDSDYPHEKIEILVGSDGSSDRTQEIVERFRDHAVGLISFPEQRGKSAIQNGLVAAATGSILVFTDADCLLPTDALRCLVHRFSDPRVCLVTGAPQYRNAAATATTASEGFYVRYETWLRKLESERGLLAMASGSLFAVRRSLWQPLAPNEGDDFALPLRAARAGLLNVLEARACPVTELAQDNPRALLRLKVRIISKDFRALLTNRDLLNPLRHGAVGVGLCSHKLLRWLVPYFLLAVFASNIFLVHQPFFQIALVLQVAFYMAATVGIVRRDKVRSRLVSVPMSFCTVNLAAALGIAKALAGRVSGAWKPERSATAEPAYARRAPASDR
jgi:cellulose synthase/poly-beta-1,6-N-acetylglucosamine synthase-like glycosyltransferase